MLDKLGEKFRQEIREREKNWKELNKNKWEDLGQVESHLRHIALELEKEAKQDQGEHLKLLEQLG